ncbi:Ig-like domain-containing protein [Moheibacter sediminis]|uniref:Uncharacterized protein n=1 Tax=Moheibacter sediminis TaxID=1434700 RepID=A0A1W2AHU5_9FLAO|nr:Ig-like domain-containing protein [Moheibacter sediminis]SMC59838.1 hypothetical protein SAMN06296427_104149 [Moheibacter sediminis]
MKSKAYLKLSIICLLFLFLSCNNDDSDNNSNDSEFPKIELVVTNPYIIQPGSTKIIANVSDDTGISKVEFYDELENLRFTDLEQPYEFELNYGANAYGNERYHAIVHDLSDKTSTSEQKEIRVNVEREVPVLEITLEKTYYTPTDGIVPKAKLIGAPGKSGTIYFTRHYGLNCPGAFNYINFHHFTDGNVDGLSYQFNNGETGSFSMSARVQISGIPEIISNCVDHYVN